MPALFFCVKKRIKWGGSAFLPDAEEGFSAPVLWGDFLTRCAENLSVPFAMERPHPKDDEVPGQRAPIRCREAGPPFSQSLSAGSSTGDKAETEDALPQRRPAAFWENADFSDAGAG